MNIHKRPTHAHPLRPILRAAALALLALTCLAAPAAAQDDTGPLPPGDVTAELGPPVSGAIAC